MWHGIPGVVVREVGRHDGGVMVNLGGERRTVERHLLRDDPLEPGDWIVVHEGRAVRRIDRVEALAWLRMLRSIGLPHGGNGDLSGIPGIG